VYQILLSAGKTSIPLLILIVKIAIVFHLACLSPVLLIVKNARDLLNLISPGTLQLFIQHIGLKENGNLENSLLHQLKMNRFIIGAWNTRKDWKR